MNKYIYCKHARKPDDRLWDILYWIWALRWILMCLLQWEMLYIQWKSTLQQMWIYKAFSLHKGQRLTFSSPFDNNGEWNIVDWYVHQYTTNPLWTQVLWISFFRILQVSLNLTQFRMHALFYAMQVCSVTDLTITRNKL